MAGKKRGQNPSQLLREAVDAHDKAVRSGEISKHELWQGALDNAKACLEEEAVKLEGSIEYRANISAAISLKRIADVLDESMSIYKKELLRPGSSHD